MKRFISLMMAVVMLLSFGTRVFANAATLNASSKYEDVELLRETILNMNEDEKALFLLMIQSSIEEQEFYKENIDKNYEIKYEKDIENIDTYVDDFSTSFQMQAASSALAYFNAEIAKLGLSTTTTMMFKAVAASIAASLADGPLPVGDILLLITGSITVVYIAANWDEIGPKWNQIVDLFAETFSSIASSIRQAFSRLKDDVMEELGPEVKVSVSGQTLTVGNNSFYCGVVAESAAIDMQKKGHYYYPAVIYKDSVWVCPVDIDRNTALEILRGNNSEGGVFAVSDSRARGLCSSLGGAEGPEGDAKSGYWYHYHPKNYRRAHCWFIY